MLIYTHAHPLHSKYSEDPAQDVAAYLQTAQAAGVGTVLGVACRRSEWQPMLAAAQSHSMLKVIAGVHPHDADEAITEAELNTLATHPLVVALGETGLDYHYPDIAPRAVQHASFHRHLQAAKQHGLPAVIHTRDAEADTIAILREHQGTAFVLHCFSGTTWLAEQGLSLGGYLSLSGILTFGKSASEIAEVARTAPRDRVLLETDAPYLAPAPHRGKRNSSALMPHTAQYLADLWQVGIADVAAITTANAKRLFTRLN